MTLLATSVALSGFGGGEWKELWRKRGRGEAGGGGETEGGLGVGGLGGSLCPAEGNSVSASAEGVWKGYQVEVHWEGGGGGLYVRTENLLFQNLHALWQREMMLFEVGGKWGKASVLLHSP